MNPLSNIAKEIEALQTDVKSLEVSLREIKQGLIPCRDYSFSMVSDVLQALNGITETLPERRKALDRVSYQIDQARSRIRELTVRGGKVGQENLLSRQKEKLIDLQHVLRDLLSDLEAVEHFQLNFRGRLDRLKG